jgi:molybdopterin-guanine dinucleotide biosynthesis protein A
MIDRMAELWPHTGAVLAGGSSTRMGVPKEDLLLPGGMSMIGRVIQTLEKVCARVVTVGGEHMVQQNVLDLRHGAGPLGGIEALLASGLDDNYLVCPSDIPLITPELVRRLNAPSDSVATFFEVQGDPVHSLPLRISVAALDTVSAALDAGRNAIHTVLAELETERVSISRAEAAGLRNINTPEDYSAI